MGAAALEMAAEYGKDNLKITFVHMNRPWERCLLAWSSHNECFMDHNNCEGPLQMPPRSSFAMQGKELAFRW